MFSLLVTGGVTSFCVEMQVKNIEFQMETVYLETEKEMLTQHIMERSNCKPSQNLTVSDFSLSIASKFTG